MGEVAILGKRGYSQGNNEQLQLNGKLLVTFYNGVRDGKTIMYYEDGHVMFQKYYSNGLLHGPATIYDPKGQLLRHSVYKNGVMTNDTRYYPSGAVNYTFKNDSSGWRVTLSRRENGELQMIHRSRGDSTISDYFMKEVRYLSVTDNKSMKRSIFIVYDNSGRVIAVRICIRFKCSLKVYSRRRFRKTEYHKLWEKDLHN